MIQIPSDKPVVIFCSYRTGSTALCDYFAKQHKWANFDEVFHPLLLKRLESFKDHIIRWDKKRYVIKIMPDQMKNQHLSLIEDLILQSTLIRLKRKSVVDQIASFYICCQLEQWHYTDSEYKDFSVNLDPYKLAYSIEYILNNNVALDNIKYKFDYELDYDDLGHLSSMYKLSQKPKNYLELQNHIKEKLKYHG
jgi:LPS sulfotransferase NodH